MNSVILTSNSEEECLRELKLYIAENQTLEDFSEFLDDEAFLLHFVRGMKYNSDKAYIALENYINIRRIKYKEMFKLLKPSTSIALDIRSVRILRNRDHLSRLVVLTRINCWDPKKISTDEYTNMVVLCVEEMWNYIDAEKNGIVLIFDVTGYSLQHTMALSIAAIMKYVNILWNNFPLRPQAVHFVNEIYLTNLVIQMVKPLLPKKIRKRLNLHGSNLELLHNHFSPSILPKVLGGNLSEDEAFDMTFEKRIRDKENYYTKFSSVLKDY